MTHAASFASGGMVGKDNIVFGRGRAAIRALTTLPAAESIPTLFPHREHGRPLNVDDVRALPVLASTIVSLPVINQNRCKPCRLSAQETANSRQWIASSSCYRRYQKSQE